MRQMVVLSGKGGTGKTTLAASLVRLAGRAVAADADVDAANLALLLDGEDQAPHRFVGGRRAVVDAQRCAACGVCAAVCRFDALEGPPGAVPRVRSLACEGCGACAIVCAMEAIGFRENVSGTWRVRRLAEVWLVHAALGVAEDNSGKLVTVVRQEARRIAEREGVDLLIVDGPPGVGCPVHAALTGADELVAVTEPTPSGVHDLRRLLGLARHFGVPTRVVINKWDLAPALSDGIDRLATAAGTSVLGRIPFDRSVPRALALRRLPIDDAVSPAVRDSIRGIADRLGITPRARLAASSV